MLPRLTKKQILIFDYICEHRSVHGESPSMATIGRVTHTGTRQSVFLHLKLLIRKGYVSEEYIPTRAGLLQRAEDYDKPERVKQHLKHSKRDTVVEDEELSRSAGHQGE